MGVHHGMQAVLRSRTYVFTAFGSRWPGIPFLILALSGKLALGPVAPSSTWLAVALRISSMKE